MSATACKQCRAYICQCHVPWPNVLPCLSRKQAEELLALVRAQPQKKWVPIERNLLKALREYSGGKEYPDREDAPRTSETQEREAKAVKTLLVEVAPDGGEDPDHGF